MFDDLVQFLVERLREMDPSLRDVPGSKMYTYVINPLLRRLAADLPVMEAADFIRARVANAYPGLDLGESSNFTDLFINPLTALLEPLRIEMARVRTSNSVEDPNTLTDEEVERKLSNLYLPRNTGEFALGTVRIYYPTARSVSVDQSVLFSTRDGLQFVPTDARVVQPEEMLRSGSRYYVDVDVRSRDPISETAPRNSVVEQDGLDGNPQVTNPNPITGGSDPETAREYLARAPLAVSERAVNTTRGIQAALLAFMPELDAVRVVGFGEPEMLRDLVTLTAEPPVPTPGELLHSTAQFRTERSIVLDSDEEFPFTNRVRVVSPPTSKLESVLSARYLRVSDGNGRYDDALLSRYRRIVAAEQDGDDVVLLLSDFVAFPDPGAVTGVTSGGILDTLANGGPFNPFPWQGGEYSLLAESSEGETVVRGAPLPMADVAAISGYPNMPDSALIGQDFLVVCSTDAYTTTFMSMHEKLDVYPVREVRKDAGYIRVAAKSGLVPNADRVQAVDGAVDYPDSDEDLLYANQLRVVAFGTPDYRATSVVSRYTDSVAEFAKYPGCSLVLRDPGEEVTWSANASAANDAILALPGSYDFGSAGVKAGDFIAVAVVRDLRTITGDMSEIPFTPFDGTLEEFPNFLEWTSWGRVARVRDNGSIIVVGLQSNRLQALDGTSQSSNFNWAAGSFDVSQAESARLLWTAWRSDAAAIAPDGTVLKSYPSIEYLPAHAFFGLTTPTVAPRAASYNRDGLDTSSLAAQNRGLDLAEPSHRAVYIRLDKPLQQVIRDGDFSFSKFFGVELVSLNPFSGVSWLFAQERYEGEIEVEVSSGSTEKVLRITSVAPVLQGATAINDYGTSVDFSAQLPNMQGYAGYLLPHPLGSSWLSEVPAWASNFVDGNTLYNQVIQLFGEEEYHSRDIPLISVGNMPGSVPFPEQFLSPAQFLPNQIHVGGLIDVYIKPASLASNELSFNSRPERSTSEVVLTGSDGLVDPAINPSAFYSPSLSSWLAANTGIPALGSGYVGQSPDGEQFAVVLLEPDGVLDTTALRPKTAVPGGFTTDADWSGLAGPVPNIRWALVKSISTSTSAPKVLLQGGFDLNGFLGRSEVRISSGVKFQSSPDEATIYLEVFSGASAGVYQIQSAGATKLQLDRPLVFDVVDMEYRVFVMQDAVSSTGVVVKVDSLSYESEEGVLQVPYRHPLEVAPGDLASLNDDPVTDDLLGESAVYFSDGIAAPTLTIDTSGFSWIDEGVRVNDAVFVENTEESERYFYVTAITATTLTLDRVVPPKQTTSVGFRVGRPALTTTRVYFEGPTYFEVNQQTRLTCYDSDNVERILRPSQDEYGVLYQSDKRFPPCTASNYAITPRSLDFSDEIFACGVRVGDHVDVISLDILTSAVTTQAFSLTNQRLAFEVDGVLRFVTFATPGTMTYAEVAAEINAQLGTYMYADVSSNKLRIASRSHVVVVDEGTPGILENLQFLTSGAVLDNKPGGSQYFGRFEITELRYDAATGVSSIIIGTEFVDRVYRAGDRYMVDIVRQGSQVFYPGDFQSEGPLYYVDVKMVLLDPQDGTISGLLPGVLSGYISLGYDYVGSDEQYAFSVLENFQIRVTPIFVGIGGRSLLGAVTLAGASASAVVQETLDVGIAQDYLLRRDTKDTCANVLVKHVTPAFPVVPLSVGPGSNRTAILEACSEYFRSLFGRNTFEVSDLVDSLYRANVRYVGLPLRAGFLVIGQDRVMRLKRTESRLVLSQDEHVMNDVSLVTIELEG